MRDVTDLLTEAAPGPTTDVDPDAVWTGGRTRRRRRHVLTAIIGFVGIVGAGIGTAQVLSTPRPAPVIEEPRPGEASPDRTETPDEPVDLASPRPVADSPDVAERSGAAARFVSCEGPLHLGGWASDFGGPSGVAGPEGALQEFVESGPWELPTDGYRPVAKDGGRVLFTYDVDGAAKVAVIVADAAQGTELSPPGEVWSVEVFATCDPAEYDPATTDQWERTIWTDADGDRVPSSTITSYPGPSHCNWQSATFLRLDDRQYLRDPRGVLRGRTVADYEASTELPSDARDTGYRDGDRELWLAADESIAYVVTESAVEAWPSTTRTVACM